MKSKLCSLTCIAALVMVLLAPVSAADSKSANRMLKQQERYTLSLELEFSKKDQNPLEQAISVLFDVGPNGYATGFLVGNGLVMTAYHVISGNLSATKKVMLGFKASDELSVKVYVDGCRAKVMKVDKEADLALLEMCRGSKNTRAPKFQTAPNKDDKLFLIARPHGDKVVSHGSFYGNYMLGNQEYWSVKIDSRDGFSGSPVYNSNAEVVGVFSGYDWSQKLALISPSIRAQKLLEDYNSTVKP
ncbi:MAG TPA: serine protease [Pyrinomonadaceae bacterium]|jgi:S1-C subfamily serine protease|nr:serine protease [Pyrinomonadaceae bacterium]